MSEEILRRDGELYLSLETVATVYRVEAVWLRRVYEAGLIGAGLVQETRVWIAAVELDRVATVLRLRTVLGPDVEALAWALESPPG